jgi:hypothetical protein
MPYSPLKVNRCFGGTCLLHLRIEEEDKQGNSKKQATRELLGLHFNSDDGGDMFLRNIGGLLTDYTPYTPEDRTLHCQIIFI